MHHRATNVVRIQLRGEFDASVKGSLAELLRPAETADTVILNLTETTYMDSTALGCLLNLHKQLRARGAGTVHIVGVRPHIRKLFNIAGLDKVFEISDTASSGPLRRGGASLSRRSDP